ncbi:MAG: hypothetical protein H6807_13755 [Planctomycetes bacterium]|nr:hypothetical protein [Planctomycetota bacterium]
MNRFLDSRELIRRLKEGSPIEVEGDVVRLPRFTEIKESDPAEFGARGNHELIVAKARTATWCLWPLDRKATFSANDGKKFVKILDAIGETIPQKPVKGWVLTTAPVAEDARELLNEADHRINRIEIA